MEYKEVVMEMEEVDVVMESKHSVSEAEIGRGGASEAQLIC